jgi:hypothetical protein|tara:strand:- start:5 stop:427 length:423 start_codon:yes stop_codon:yes gene_type:complete
LAIDYWKPEYEVCFDVNILEVFSKSNWGAQVVWLLSDYKGNTLKVFFASVNDKEFNLITEYLNANYEVKNRSILYKGLSIKEVYSSKFSFDDNNELKFHFKGEKRSIPLTFSPKKFIVNASGVKAKVGYSSIWLYSRHKF